MGTKKIVLFLTLAIFYIVSAGQALCFCWGGYEEEAEDYKMQLTPVSRELMKDTRPLPRYSPDVTSYDNCKLTGCNLVDPAKTIRVGAIIGRDDRIHVDAPQLQGWSPHGHLDMTFADGNFIGSGLLVGPRHVVTAGHCVFGKGWATAISFTPGLNETARPYGSAHVKRIYTVKEWTNNKDSNNDFAMLILDRDIGNQVGWYGLMTPSDAFLKKLTINVTGYPGDKGGDKLYTMEGQVGRFDSEILKYSIDTYGGQSGAGVWAALKDKNRYCCAIHTSGRPNVENTATRINDAKFDLLVDWMQRS